jgi:hypothetical protein
MVLVIVRQQFSRIIRNKNTTRIVAFIHYDSDDVREDNNRLYLLHV